ncbi:MAG: permease [Candidatus Omnitrophica bacterium]|nr:permease [Candidatus Omnitrophota bacterium]
MGSCCTSEKPKKNILANRVVLLALLIVAVLLASYYLPFLAPFRFAFLAYVRMMFWPLVIGLFLGGVIDYYIPREYVSLLLAGKRKRNILYAVLWGFMMTLCSHGILALAVQLYKKGASPASVVAFLLASPWANFPLTLMLVGFFGPAKAGYIVLSAIVVALVTGWIFQVLERKGLIEANPHTLELSASVNIMEDLRQRAGAYRFDIAGDLKGIFRGVKELAGMIIWWILLGTALAAMAQAYIPTPFFHQFMGKSLGGMSVTLLVATVIETCSAGSSPLAFEIYRQTGALGNALVFLMAGVATNYTALGLLWTNAGRRTALWLPLVSVPFVLVFGYLANRLF